MLGALFQLVLAVGLTAMGVIALQRDKGAFAGIALALAAVVTIALIRYGGVMAAGRHYRSGRKSSSWRELGRVPFGGRLLARQHRAYYGLLRTACRMDRAEWEEAIAEAHRVLDLERIPQANWATAHAAIAKCCLEIGDIRRAKDHLARAKGLPRKQRLDRLIAEVEEGLREERLGSEGRGEPAEGGVSPPA